MKKLLFIAGFLFLFLGAFSQTQKVKSVYKKGNNELKAIIHYDSKGNITNHYMFLTGRNMRYQHISDAISVFTGTPKEMLDFIKGVQIFAIEHKDDSNVYGQINDVRVFHDKYYGIRYNRIFKDSGYIEMKDGDFDKYIKKIISYCEKEKIEIE